MIFKHKSLSDSVVMKEFEKVAISKGMVKVEVLSKTASENEKVNLNPSENLIIDMFNLAEGLRIKGFTKEADSLEQKVLAYKTAETHLYRAIDEDSEDLLEFAHPKKNRVKFEAKDGHGDFEDTLSQHEKMLAIVNKKVANECNSALEKTAEILGLKKKADLTPDDTAIININYYKAETIKALNKQAGFYFVQRDYNDAESVLYFGHKEDNVGFPLVENNRESETVNNEQFYKDLLSYFKSSSNITEEKWHTFLLGHVGFNDLFSSDNVNHANKNLEDLYAKFINKISTLPEIKKTNGVIDFDSVNKVIDGIHSLFDQYSGFTIKAITDNDGELENVIRLEFIQNILDSAKSLLNSSSITKPKTGLDEILTADRVNVIAGRFDSLFTEATKAKDSDPSYFKDVAEIIRAGENKPYKETFDKLVAFDKDLSAATDLNQLDLGAQAWQKHFSKVASKAVKMMKSARTIPTSTVPASFTQPNQVQKSVSVSSQSNFEQSFPEEYTAVANMQEAVHKLADSLPQILKNKIDPGSIENIVDQLKSTGYGDKGSRGISVDGEWGPATQKALETAQSILNNPTVNQKVNLTTEQQRSAGKLVNENADVVKLAENNTNQIYQALNNLNIDVKDKLPAEDNSPYLDSLPENVNIFGSSDATEDKKSNINLAQENLASATSLFRFLSLHNLLQNHDSGFTAKEWDAVIRWFYTRASQQLQDPNQTNKKSKAIYVKLLEHLYDTLRNYVENNPSSDQVLSSKAIDTNSPQAQANKPNGDTVPATYTQNVSNSGEAEGHDVSNDLAKYSPAPYGYTFNLSRLHDKYSGVMNSYDSYSPFINNEVTFNVDDFGYSPQNIFSKYIKGLSVPELLHLNNITPSDQINQAMNQVGSPFSNSIKLRAYYIAMYDLCNGLLNDLQSILENWKQDPHHPTAEENKLDAAWDKWNQALYRMIQRVNQALQENGPVPPMGVR